MIESETNVFDRGGIGHVDLRERRFGRFFVRREGGAIGQRNGSLTARVWTDCRRPPIYGIGPASVATAGRRFIMRAIAFALLIAAAPMATSAAIAAEPTASKDVAALPAGAYQIDPTHTSVTWRVSHLGLSGYTARFDKISGSLKLDPKAPEASMLSVSIETNSVSTGLPNFDKKIATDYFKAETSPKIDFQSGKVQRTGADTALVTGNLTLAGVTKPVTLDVTWNGGTFNRFAQAYGIGFSVTGKIKRSDFGLTQLAGAVGDEVELLIQAEFVNKGQ
jgi:polyisoprenoid-binding protein YceI